MGLVWKMLQTATPLRSVSRWPWNTVHLWEWPQEIFQTISGFKCGLEEAGISTIKTNPLTAALKFVSISRSSDSIEVHSFVAEMFASSFSGTGSSWMRCVSERWQDVKNQSSHRRLGICLQNSVQILMQSIVRKFTQSDLMLNCLPQFSSP